LLWFDDIGLSLVLTDDMDKIAAVFTELDKQVCGKAKPGLLDMPGVTPAQVGGFFEAAASRPQSKIEAKNCPHCSQVFLDSEEHHHDPRNIPVSVSETGNIRFKEMKIDDPANHFKGHGATSESTNLYDPSWSLFAAYRTLFRQWSLLYRIGDANRKRGHAPTAIRELLRLMLGYYRGLQVDPLAD
jgi:hypothetical protein